MTFQINSILRFENMVDVYNPEWRQGVIRRVIQSVYQDEQFVTIINDWLIFLFTEMRVWDGHWEDPDHEPQRLYK